MRVQRSGGRAGWATARATELTTDLNAVYFINDKRGWVAGDKGTVLQTQDGGITWQRQSIATRDSINDIFFRTKDDGYLLAGNRIWTTETGGDAWREGVRFDNRLFAEATPELYSIYFANKRRGWIVGSLSRGENVIDALLLTTQDGGASWQRMNVPTKSELIDLDFDDELQGWIVGANGTILNTRDGGTTWTPQTSNTRVTLYNVEFRSERKGWAVGENGTVLRTANGGATWEAGRTPIRSTLLSVRFATDTEGYAVGRAGVILRSNDGGKTWIQQESNTRENFYALYLRGSRGWAVGGKGLVAQYER